MKLDITGRNIDVTPAIRDYTRDKFAKIEKWIDVIETHVILSVEKHRHIVEIVLKGRHQTFTGAEETGDMYASIGNAVEKIEKQVRRQKEKVADRRKHGLPAPEIAAMAPLSGPEVEEEATPAGNASPRIIRSNNHSMKPMSAEDAALALAGSEQSFVVFRDAGSQRINVLYRRKDGHLGLIDPGE